jgi:hypothetical protein
MSSSRNRWTFHFPKTSGTHGGFEIAPYEMTFKMRRGEFDFARAQFNNQVGDMIQKHTDPKNDDAQLVEAQPVEIMFNGERLHTLYFAPDYVTYGDDATHIELHDMQESLDTGIVDKKWGEVSLQDAYKYVFEKRNNNLLKDIKFSIPEQVDTQLTPSRINTGPVPIIRVPVDTIIEREGGENERVIKGKYTLDFDNISPAKAIWKMNKQFGLLTWTDEDHNLWVGTPETMMTPHIAAPDDTRVWRYDSDAVNVSHPKDPIYAVIIEGRWMDEEGIGSTDDILDWFTQTGESEAIGNSDDDENERGFGDYRAEGVAVRPNVDKREGRVIKKKDVDAKKDSLDDLALKQLREESRSQNNGSVDIVPELSGEEVSRLVDLDIGDVLQLVPNDDWFKIPQQDSGSLNGPDPDIEPPFGGHVHNEAYNVNGITHELSQGNWTMNVQISMFQDMQVGSFLRFFDPRSGKFLKEEDVYLDADGIIPDFLDHPFERSSIMNQPNTRINEDGEVVEVDEDDELSVRTRD